MFWQTYICEIAGRGCELNHSRPIAAKFQERSPQEASTALVILRKALSQRRVGNRPNRVEPRRLKRRPKDCKLLTKPRQEARDELLAGRVPDLTGRTRFGA